jgi:hypothetical protein
MPCRGLATSVSLCRILVDVSAADSGGWSVEVRLDGATKPVVPVFGIAAAVLPGTDFEQRVPLVPESRRRPVGTLADALCAGDVDRTAAVIGRLADRRPEHGDVVAYGRWLFECLLAPAWPSITRLRVLRNRRGVELALRGPAEEADLHRLVWEAMHDGRTALAASKGRLVAITRLIPPEITHAPDSFEQPATIDRLPRLLFAAGSPLVDEDVRPGAMFMGLLRAFEQEGSCVPAGVQAVSIDGLKETCWRFRPDVVHLVAHGAIGKGGKVSLTLGGDGATAEDLAAAITAGGRPLAVVLSPCQTGPAGGPAGTAPLAAELVARGDIPIVSVIAGDVSEQACRLYTRRLVMAVNDGESVVEASARGRRAALLNSRNRDEQLSWAMPALFLASSLQPDFQLVSPGPCQELVNLGERLGLRQRPVFIGSQEILRIIDDDLIQDAPSKSTGFVAIVNDDISGLGGTRLLREIGYRLLRLGHLPLLLGPYGETSAPKSLRAVLVDILERALDALEPFEIRPVPFGVFGADPEWAVPSPSLSLREVQEKVVDFRDGPELDPERVRPLLAADLAALARQVAAAGEPFGPHTRVVVLADEIHHWVRGLDGVLAILRRNLMSGLGTAECPVPLVATASLKTAGGPRLKAFIDEHAVLGFRSRYLMPLDLPNAILGFEWVLLHPWLPDGGAGRGAVYTRAPAAEDTLLQDSFGVLNGMPTKVTSALYDVAQVLVSLDQYISDDDEQAWQSYVGKYG